MRLVRAPPQQQKGTRILFKIILKGSLNIKIKRIKPYPPIFSKIAARIIDPAIGASTCAFGSHRWRPNIGTLTRNAIRQSKDNIGVFCKFLLNLNNGIDR